VSAAVHLPGKLNVYTDRPSRAGQDMFQEATPSQPLLTWLAKRPSFKGVHSFSTRPSSPSQGLLAIPTPVNRESDIAATHQLRSKHKHIAVVLPEAAYADNRWAFLKRHFRRLETLPGSLPIYSKAATRTDPLWASPLTLPSQPPGKWNVWVPR
jgi:hypothetical protein